MFQTASIGQHWTGKRRFWYGCADLAAWRCLALHFANDLVTQNLAAHGPNQYIVLRSRPCPEPYDEPFIQIQANRKFAAGFDERRCDLCICAVKVENDERPIGIPKLLTTGRTGNSLPMKLCRKDS